MTRKERRVAKYERMTPDERRDATREFDQEMVIERSRPLTATERRAWEKARRKPGRPCRSARVKVISVSVEKSLLARCDHLAEDLGISRASLIERGLRAALAACGRL